MKKIILIQIATLLVAIKAHATIPDNFASAQVLSGNPVSVTNNNTTATTETGEPAATGLNTLWYTWTAPASGQATLTTAGSGSFNIILTVWMGNSVANIKSVVSVGAGTFPAVEFPVVAGTVYYICTGSYNSGSYGNIQVNLSLNTSSPLDTLAFIGTATAANDNFVNRIVTSTEFGSFVAYNRSATREALETTPGLQTVWWDYQAPANGLLDINDLGDGTWNFNKYISVYSGTAVQSLELLTPSVLNDGGDCYLPVIQGNDYQICISSYNSGSGGPIVLTFSLDTTYLNAFDISGGATFTNDNFNSATVLTGATPAVVAYNTYATREALEPAGNGLQTVWFKWTAPAAGLTQIVTQDSDSFNKYVTVYTGTSINALTLITQPSVSATPTASFTAIAGQTYYISVGNYNSGSTGSIVLSIFGQPGTTTGPTLSIAQAFKVSFATVTNKIYRVQQSSDLQTWNTLTNVINGNNSVQSVFIDPQGAANKSYRVSVQ